MRIGRLLADQLGDVGRQRADGARLDAAVGVEQLVQLVRVDGARRRRCRRRRRGRVGPQRRSVEAGVLAQLPEGQVVAHQVREAFRVQQRSQMHLMGPQNKTKRIPSVDRQVAVLSS